MGGGVGGRSSVCLADSGGRRRENWLDGQTDADGLSCRRRSMLGLAGFPIAPDRASLPPLSQTIPAWTIRTTGATVCSFHLPVTPRARYRESFHHVTLTSVKICI